MKITAIRGGLVGTHIPLEYVKQRYFAVTRTLAPDKDY